ncbi:hypothetical protein GCM10011390_19910 [Aureimonas endophytica]|uniref:GDSL-like lipase/acylhydrolase family protein n=1 Tax=Aureimonas endophytica TaxID=2027858 RepID=A0A916ZK36_9HYPH|nr:hypothetical protein [Aureimonas endophytica]GGE01100.1 hypothetical protein GCM10011390_19910 [Aureimonas endophytica]
MTRFLPPFAVLAAGPTIGVLAAEAEAGALALDLAPLAPGETRELIGGNGALALDAAGRLVRGSAPCCGETVQALIRQRHGAARVETAVAVSFAPSRRLWRGHGQGMRLVEGFVDGALRSGTSRSCHFSNHAFRRLRVVLPVFSSEGRPIVDRLFDGPRSDLAFQVGIEFPFRDAFDGIAPRIPVTFEGRNFALYKREGWDEAVGHILSDPIDLGLLVPPRAKLGLWTTVERLGEAAEKTLPYSWTGSSFVQRHGGVEYAATSRIAALGGESDAALANSSIKGFGERQTGAIPFFTPAMLLIEGEDSRECVVIHGDSIAKGVGSGGPGSDAFGDTQGDAEGNFGLLDAGLYHDARVDFVNLGRGSDGNKYLFDPIASRYRRALRQLAAPTLTVNMNGHNDISQPMPVEGWAGGRTYRAGDAMRLGGRVYACVAGGVSGRDRPAETEIPPLDGDVRWQFVGDGRKGDDYSALLCLSRMAAFNALLKADLPAGRLLGFCITPDSDSAAKDWSGPAQTPRNGWGGADSRRGIVNGHIRRRHPLLGLDGVIDVNTVLEAGYPQETSCWSFAAGRVTVDGTHLNARGNDLARGPVATAVRAALGAPR